MPDPIEQLSNDPKVRLQERNLDLKLKEIEIRKRAIELPVELAQLGLRGTLTGAIAGAILLVILAVISAWTEKVQISGWHLCVITGTICITVVLYGAFVFDRSFRLAGQWEKYSLQVGAGKHLETTNASALTALKAEIAGLKKEDRATLLRWLQEREDAMNEEK